jgi:hypothetical protein
VLPAAAEAKLEGSGEGIMLTMDGIHLSRNTTKRAQRHGFFAVEDDTLKQRLIWHRTRQ